MPVLPSNEIEDSVRLHATISREMDAALATGPTLTGQSKSSVIRRGIALALVELNLWDADAPDRELPTPTAGARGRTATRKKD